MHCVPDCIADCVRLAIPQPPERQRIGNQINAAMISARADFVNVRWLRRMLGLARLRSPDWTDSGSDLSTVQMGILPLLGRRRGFDRCYGSFDCVIYGLTNSGVLKRGGSEACDEAEMEVDEPIRMRVRVRNWWPPRW